MSRERGKRMRRGEISILVKREQQQQHVFFFFWKRFWTSVWIEKERERERERDDFCLERKERNFFKIKDKRDMNHEIPRGLSPTITWPPRQWHNGPADRPTISRLTVFSTLHFQRSLANFPRGNFRGDDFLQWAREQRRPWTRISIAR